MSAWLYQNVTNNNEPWGPNEYRMEVWEGIPVTWPVGTIRSRGNQKKIVRGDIVVFFFAKTGNLEPGIYGWGIILEIIESKTRNRIKFQVCAPSDYRKIAVAWDLELEKLVNRIRGKMTQATMWSINNEELDIFKKKLSAI